MGDLTPKKKKTSKYHVNKWTQGFNCLYFTQCSIQRYSGKGKELIYELLLLPELTN